METPVPRDDDAPDALRPGLHGSPRDLPILALLTSMWERNGDLVRAREAALQWAATCPLDTHAHYRLGLIEQQLGNYVAAVERFELTANMTDPGDALGDAAIDALDVLDNIQIRQALALWEVDTGFRATLDSDPYLALRERGFALSDSGLQMVLRGVHLMSGRFRGRSPRPC